MDGRFPVGIALQIAGRRVVMVPPWMGRELLEGITGSLSQVSGGCCTAGA